LQKQTTFPDTCIADDDECHLPHRGLLRLFAHIEIWFCAKETFDKTQFIEKSLFAK
jgi:hypothetical protein